MGDFNNVNIQWNTRKKAQGEDQFDTRGARLLDLVLSSQKESVDNVKISLDQSHHNHKDNETESGDKYHSDWS